MRYIKMSESQKSATSVKINRKSPMCQGSKPSYQYRVFVRMNQENKCIGKALLEFIWRKILLVPA